MIALKTWREVRALAFLYTTLLEVQLVISILLWPWLRDQAPALARLAPAHFIKRWVEGITDPDASAAYSAYIALQAFFKGTNSVGLAFALVFGSLIVARERENQTLEFLLAKPVSRTRVLLTKFVVMGLALGVPVFLTSWSVIPLSWIVGEDVPFGPLTLASAYATLFVLLLLAATTVVSVRARTQMHTAAFVGAVLILQVGSYFVQEIRVISLFRLSDYDIYGPVLAGNVSVSKLMLGHGVWVLGATLAAYVVADRLFQKAAL